jgi:hypothetical protein
MKTINSILIKKNHIFCVAYRLIGLFFIFTTFSKTRNFYQLEEIFLFFGFPAYTTEFFSWGIIIFELILGVGMFFLIMEKVLVAISTFTLIFFSGILVYLLFQPEPLYCGCTGGMRLFESVFAEDLFGLFRNIFFLFFTISSWRQIYLADKENDFNSKA